MSFWRNRISYWPRPRLRSQSPTSMIDPRSVAADHGPGETPSLGEAAARRLGRRRRRPGRLLTRYSRVRGETPPPRAGGAEGPVPEAGADAEIGGVVVVMRHMANPRRVEPVARLEREMMRRVMDEHVGGVAEEHPAGEPAGGDGVEHAHGE